MLMSYKPYISLLVGSVYASKDLLIPNLSHSFTAAVRGRESSSHILAVSIIRYWQNEMDLKLT